MSLRSIRGIVHCPSLSNSPALRLCKGKVSWNSTSSWLTQSSPQVSGDWALLSAWGRRKNLPPSPKVPLYKIQHLENEEHVNNRQEDPGKVDNTKSAQPPTHIRTSATRKACKVLVIGDSLLRGTEAPICCPDSFSREVCCLPGARICNVTERLPSQITICSYYSM